MDSWYYSLKSLFLLEDISSNTHPLELFHGNLGYWSFGVASVSLVIALLALYYQKKATDNLDKMVPGQMIFDEIVCNLHMTYLNIEAVFFGEKSYMEYPVPLIFSSAKLPEDIIVLSHYENTKQCYDEALKLKMAWRNYNVHIEKLIDYFLNFDKQIVLNFAKLLLFLTKEQIISLNNFKINLCKEHLIKDTMGTDQKLAWFIINRFFEYIQLIDENKELDTTRSNITKETIDMHLMNSLIPQTVDFQNYLKSNLYFDIVDEGINDDYTNDLKTENIIKDISNEKYDFIGKYLEKRPSKPISQIDFSDFSNTYFTYIEPIIVGYLRYEYYILLHPDYDKSEEVTENKNEIPSNSTIEGKQQKNSSKTKEKSGSTKANGEKNNPKTTNKNNK